MTRFSRNEAAARADFTIIRYAQVWEDADILLEALAIQPEDECLSIASAGDNALAMLAKGPRRVVALDMNPAQLACVELRVAAFRRLEHREVLELVGSEPSQRRRALYQSIRLDLSPEARAFWDERATIIAKGIGHGGKFENYFRIFRERILPLVHSRRTVARLLEPRLARDEFYSSVWDTRRWRLLFRIFFSRAMMGALGRDPSFFRYVEGSVAERILERTRHALTELDPAANPYLQWILTGRHLTALPFYLRESNFEAIRRNLDRFEWHRAALEDYLGSPGARKFSKFNLSDIFEYLSEQNAEGLFASIVTSARPGARLAYWNMLVPRSAPASLRDRVFPMTDLAEDLHRRDQAFFYSRFVVEEVQ